MADADLAIQTEALMKRYDDKEALSGFDLEVPRGMVYGLLGPNGAGKTTAVRVLSTLLKADGGTARVAGYDVSTQASQVRQRIGLLGQHAAVDEGLSGRQNLVMFGRLYHIGKRNAQLRADELLERFSLTEAGDKPAKQYSGGMRRRLDLAASLILAPGVLFLDEPTTGLDPRGRNDVWESVRGLVADGRTVLLTTQYLEEADQLADMISLMDGGRIVQTGTPDQLKNKLGGDRIEVVLRRPHDLDAAGRIIGSLLGAAPDVDADSRRVGAVVRDRVAALTAVARALDENGIEAEDIALRRPTLDEVFLSLTGNGAAVSAEQRNKEVISS
ncbi:daunorubicin resistance protein DrrA family ABC transporter ATP-binding protein [Streptomyces sp. NBRC 110035]|uniref:daunorubicin resistance protein DrrA family ABC transporter ATP-binding protein n=1 Tax=Streptomyces sp. NBRC 110035 TaxID=1547867 RepID=UPI0005A90AD0|nr:daunorubicin resistance protein DrrA family ABC transporter ATP-binding protein [Streptomyces sp. NBRC 110035]